MLMRSEITLLPLLALVVVGVAVLVGSLRRVRDSELQGVADRWGLPLTDANRETMRAQLTAIRRWRLAGTLAGLVLTPWLDFWTAVAVGCGGGTVVAEVARVRNTDQRAARLTVRRWSDYVRPIVAVLALVPVLVAGVVAAQVFAGTEWSRGGERGIGADEVFARSEIAALCLVPLAAVLAGLALARWMVARPQPGGDLTVEAVDHAMRAGALMAVLGVVKLAGASALLTIGGERSQVDPSGVAFGVSSLSLSLASFLGAILWMGGVALVISAVPRWRKASLGSVRHPRADPRAAST